MAKKVTVSIEDDMNGDVITPGLGGGTLAYIWDGKAYLIDLGTKNAGKYVDPLIEHSREPSPAEKDTYFRVAHRRGPAARTPRSVVAHEQQSAEANADIRRWAKAQGLSVSSRGKIAQDVLDRYNAAH